VSCPSHEPVNGDAASAMYGKMPGVAYDDYARAGLIVVWGCNASASGIHLVSHIKQGQKNGARLVVIDPRRTPLARIAEEISFRCSGRA